MASLLTSCPTFLLSQLPSFFYSDKEGTFYPRCTAICPLCDLVRHDAWVWPRAGSQIGHFRPIRIVRWGWLAVTGVENQAGDGIGVASRCECDKYDSDKNRKKGDTTRAVSQSAMSDSVPLFIAYLILLDRKCFCLPRCVCATLKRHFFYRVPLFRDNSGRLALLTGHWQCIEVKPDP